MKLMTDGYAKCGEVFTVPVAHQNITFLIGPDVAPHFFRATDDEMSNTEVSSSQCAARSGEAATACVGKSDSQRVDSPSCLRSLMPSTSPPSAPESSTAWTRRRVPSSSAGSQRP